VGPASGFLISEQPWHYGFGHGSPLERLLALEGKVLLLGSDHDTVTLLHYVEHVADFPGKRIARFKVPVEEHGARIWRDMEEFDTSGKGVHPNWPEQFFAQLTDGYLAEAKHLGGRVGDAWSYLFPARELVAYAMPIMQATAER